MAEGFSGSTALVIDDIATSGENEAVPSIGDVEKTGEGMGESSDCISANLNVLSETNEKANQKSLYTEIIEATRVSGASSTSNDSVISGVAREIHAIVGKVVGSETGEAASDEQAGTTTYPKQCNLAAASALEKGDDPTASTSASSRHSMTETQLAAQVARHAAEEAKAAAASGQGVIEIIHRAIRLIQTRMGVAMERAIVTGRSEEEALVREWRYHNGIVERCEAALAVLYKKINRIKISIHACENEAAVALECAKQADEVIDEASACGQFSRFNACFRKSLTEAAILVLYQKEYNALWTVKRIWEDTSRVDEASDSSGRNEYTQECENPERKTRIAHVVGFFVGVTILSMAALFKVSSDSFKAIITLGTLITLWTTFYWINQLRECIMNRKTEAETTVAEEQADEMLDFMESINRRLDFVDSFLSKRNAIPSSDAEESDPGSSETLRADDVPADA